MVQNAPTGGKFVKKWLQVIKCDGLGYLFHHKKYSNFDSFIKKKTKCEIPFCRRFENATTNHTPPTPPPTPGCWVLTTKLFFSKNCQSKTIFQDFYGYFELLDSKIGISFLNNKIREAYFHETPHIRAHGFATIYVIY